MIDTSQRSTQTEIMDNLEMQGEELKQTLLDLDKVNRWLGGNEITIKGVEKILRKCPFSPPVKIVDVGCGNGSLLKQVAQWGRKNEVKMELLGIDANKNAMEIARKNLSSYPEVSFKGIDVFSEDFKMIKADIILCTLTLHHFTDEEISRLMKVFTAKVGLGIVINDLQRSKAAYYLFQIFCKAFNISEINKQDGLTSILRSFKKKDLQKYGENLDVQTQELHAKWAFRYQWILFK